LLGVLIEIAASLWYQLSSMSSLRFTLIQTQLHWEDKAANLQMLKHQINSVEQLGQVVILPEMFSTGFSMKPELLAESMEGDTVQWMRKLAINKKIILTGSLMIEDDGKYYNRLIWMLPNGQFGYYDKKHLFAFGGEDKHYHPGNKRLIAAVNGFKINLQICYDLRFPVWARQQIHTTNQPEYDVLIYVANWPERRNHAWKTLLQARAIENQCYVIGVNRVGTDGNDIYHSGDSAVINPMGEVLFTKAHEETIFTTTIHKNDVDEVRDKLPFWKDADSFILLDQA
jgi:predicted amidohydrolase